VRAVVHSSGLLPSFNECNNRCWRAAQYARRLCVSCDDLCLQRLQEEVDGLQEHTETVGPQQATASQLQHEGSTALLPRDTSPCDQAETLGEQPAATAMQHDASERAQAQPPAQHQLLAPPHAPVAPHGLTPQLPNTGRAAPARRMQDAPATRCCRACGSKRYMIRGFTDACCCGVRSGRICFMSVSRLHTCVLSRASS
jgi:hypothetical protein